MSLCRTHWLGGRKYQCEDCDEITTRYNSCGDRHCPRCSGSKRADFNQKASKLLLPGVKHYQVVFTLPQELSELALANRRAMAELLNDSAWRSLSTNIRREQGYEPAGISVLHTWNQRLDAHWHVHVLVPGGGPSLDDGSWKQATPPPDSPNSEGYYLVDADRLRRAYRKRAIRRLQRLRSTGQLKLCGKFAYLQSEENWEAFVRQLKSTDWVAYIQPEQLTKTRYLGGWSNTRREFYMSRCVELLRTASSVTQAPESPRVDDSSPAEASRLVCSHCGSDRLQPIEDRPRPSWRELFRSTSASCPTWYARLQEADERRFWDGLMGAGFNDWYLEHVIESAKEPPPPPPPRPVQLYLPGLFPSRDFALESY